MTDERALTGLALPASGGVAEAAAVPRGGPCAPDDADVICRAQAGDRDAFGELYRRYAAMVHGVLLARVHWAHVDDLVHDVFLTAMNRIASLRQPAAFAGWLAAIARNRATDHLRRPASEVPIDDRVAAPDEDRDEARAVLAVLQTLPDAYRETLVLRLVEGFTGAEIAARTGMTAGSVRVNLHRGMKLLRARLQQEPRR